MVPDKRQKPSEQQTATGLVDSFISARLYPVTNKQRHLLHLKLLPLPEPGFPRREQEKLPHTAVPVPALRGISLAAKAVTGFVPPPGDKTECCILAYIIGFYLGDGEGNH